jgi:hypothetical protein
MKLNRLFTFITILTILNSCKKSNTTSNDNGGANIYVVGYSNDSAVYWKNGIQFNLTSQGNAFDVACSGNNVYICGYDSTGIIYWKNGVKVMLPVDSSTTGTASYSAISNRITAAGSDVCVLSGTVYWKNNVPFNLQTYSGETTTTTGIAIAGNDVYVSGFVDGGQDTAVYWKNGIRFILNNYGAATGIAVAGNDIYFAGVVYGQLATANSVYWKNGVEYNVPLGGGANLIAVSDSTIYVTGYSYISNLFSQVYWKNGEQELIATTQLGNPEPTVSGVASAGTDIYFSGYFEYSSSYIQATAMYWKNSTPIILRQNAWAYGIAVGN